MGLGEVIVAVCGIAATASTLCVYLVMRADVLKRRGGGTEGGTQRAIEALRAEIAALRQHETEAVLSFDSTLQTVDARLKHLEQRLLAPAAAERPALGTRAAMDESARVGIVGEAAGLSRSSMPTDPQSR
jgi:hypothetical protein